MKSLDLKLSHNDKNRQAISSTVAQNFEILPHCSIYSCKIELLVANAISLVATWSTVNTIYHCYIKIILTACFTSFLWSNMSTQTANGG